MGEQVVRLTNEAGLHARPAGRFVTAASRLSCEVKVGKGGTFVNGKSIMRLLALDCRSGDEIVIETSGEGEEAALAELVDLVSSGLGD